MNYRGRRLRFRRESCMRLKSPTSTPSRCRVPRPPFPSLVGVTHAPSLRFASACINAAGCRILPARAHPPLHSYATSRSASEQAPARSRAPVPSAVCRCDQARLPRDHGLLGFLVVLKSVGQVLGLLIN